MYLRVMETAYSEPSACANTRTIFVLGIESSCDETAASVLSRDHDGTITVLSSIIASQNEEHAPYGGVVPEIAARAHMQKIEGLIRQAIKCAKLSFEELDAVAATAGPGLIGGVITGLMSAKGLALSLGIPLIAVNHLEGHALSPRLSEPCPFPYLLLLVSGGHTQLLSVDGLGQYTRLGSTVDDAAGEAFDKTAKIMQLGFPGGPALEKMAIKGDANSISLPRPFVGKPHADFSFAGLKTATARAFAAFDAPTQQNKADLAASFQAAVTDVICDRTANAMNSFNPSGEKRFVVAGGVAANKNIRAGLEKLCQTRDYHLIAPPHKYCTDNAAMIALAGAERFAAGHMDGLDVKARPRWPLDGDSAQNKPASGSGRKGPKS